MTDSVADLPAMLTEELDVTVVPVYLRFGDEVYRDRVDISEDEFYQRLLNDPVHPNTTQPTPQDFASVYNKLSRDADGIISIHISSKLSGTYNSAVQGKKMIRKGCPIEIVDSQTVSIAIGLVLFGVLSMYFGLLISYHFNLVAAAAIILVTVVIFFIVFIVQNIRNRRVTHPQVSNHG